MTMWEEASKTFFLGVQVYSFGLYAALGMALALAVLYLQLRKRPWKKGTAALAGFLSLAVGFVVSRLFFGLMDQTLGRPLPVWALPDVTMGGFSMMGALLGACIGAILAAWLTKQSAPRLLDFLAPAFLLFVACERLGEGAVGDFGVSRYLTGELFKGSFLAVDGDGEWYLATYLLESFAALILALILLRDEKADRKAGDTFLLFLLLFGGSQTILESLRFDNHMHITFVGLQHVMAICLMSAALIVLYLRTKKTQKRLTARALLVLPVCGALVAGLLYAINHDAGAALLSVLFAVCVLVPAVLGVLVKKENLGRAAMIAIPLVVSLGVSLEFAIDRSQMNRYLIYGLYLVAVGVPVWLGIRLRREA